jgi:hypothetical protein
MSYLGSNPADNGWRGETFEMPLTFIGTVDGLCGYRQLLFDDESGHRIAHWSKAQRVPFTPGETIQARFTVKSHRRYQYQRDDYQWVDTTVVKSFKVIKEVHHVETKVAATVQHGWLWHWFKG